MDMHVDTYAVERGVRAVKNGMEKIVADAKQLQHNVAKAGQQFRDVNYDRVVAEAAAAYESIQRLAASLSRMEAATRKLCGCVDAYNDTAYRD